MTMIKFPAISALAIGVVLAAATGGRAEDAHYLELTRPMAVAGVRLRAAVYKIQWELQGTQATVTFSRKDRVVATVHGVYSTANKSVACDTLYVGKHPDGSQAIMAFGIAGSDKAIVFPAYRSHPQSPLNAPVVTGMMAGGWVSPPPSRPMITK